MPVWYTSPFGRTSSIPQCMEKWSPYGVSFVREEGGGSASDKSKRAERRSLTSDSTIHHVTEYTTPSYDRDSVSCLS